MWVTMWVQWVQNFILNLHVYINIVYHYTKLLDLFWKIQYNMIRSKHYGSYIFENDNYKHIPSIPQGGKIDTIGAGDAFTSGFAYAISCGANMETAAEFATCCSSVVVKKIHQAGFPTKQELKSLLKEINE